MWTTTTSTSNNLVFGEISSLILSEKFLACDAIHFYINSFKIRCSLKQNAKLFSIFGTKFWKCYDISLRDVCLVWNSIDSESLPSQWNKTIAFRCFQMLYHRHEPLWSFSLVMFIDDKSNRLMGISSKEANILAARSFILIFMTKRI